MVPSMLISLVSSALLFYNKHKVLFDLYRAHAEENVCTY